MKLYKAVAPCEVCGKTTILDGISDAEEVVDLVKEDHYDDEGHFFEGEVTVTQYEDEDTVKRHVYKKPRR